MCDEDRLTRLNYIFPKSVAHAVEILQYIIPADIERELVKNNEYCHLTIGLFIRDQLRLFEENDYWCVRNPEIMSEKIYNAYMQQLKCEKYFSKEEIQLFLQKPYQYASAKFIYDRDYLDHVLEKDEFKLLTGKYALFSKNTNRQAMLLSTNKLIILDKVYKYFFDNGILHISWNTHVSKLLLYQEVHFDIKTIKRGMIAHKLYLFISSMDDVAFNSNKYCLGIHTTNGSAYHLSEDMLGSTLFHYFHNQKIIPGYLWRATVLLKCFDISPAEIPSWMKYNSWIELPECLEKWKLQRIENGKK